MHSLMKHFEIESDYDQVLRLRCEDGWETVWSQCATLQDILDAYHLHVTHGCTLGR